ncbi:hypothetical protein L917_21266 [Phytophthora nicotianae]|uniref:Uncharacterized protein n=1 Tax=Phytophthora nicotianae TaxID=4792 RepID=W2JY44_PHYNI|nr:hypothetical protein L917_21266 [Phytophthora nicotianae]
MNNHVFLDKASTSAEALHTAIVGQLETVLPTFMLNIGKYFTKLS